MKYMIEAIWELHRYPTVMMLRVGWTNLHFFAPAAKNDAELSILG
jgi:hypothetical protein